MSTLFSWTKKDMKELLATCETDGLLPYIEKYMPKPSKVLESGCGAGRYVKYLHDRGWDIIGLELDKPTVEMVKKHWPELRIVLGDAADSPFKANTFDGIISLGVIEHWTEGPQTPLAEIYRTLKPGGVALINAPVMNYVRRLKKFLWWNEIMSERQATIGWRKHGGQPPNRRKKEYKYWVYPTYGDFFEYRFTTNEFTNALNKAGFEIVECKPIYQIDGLYHELNPKKMFVKYEKKQFIVNPAGKVINSILSLIPFAHPHHQMAIVRKPKITKKSGKSTSTRA